MQFDKKLHFAAGFLICAAFSFINPYAGILAAVIAGVGKEIYDYADYGKFDIFDALATWAGGLAAFCIAEAMLTLL